MSHDLPRHRQLRSRVVGINGLTFEEAVRRAEEVTKALTQTEDDPITDQLAAMRSVLLGEATSAEAPIDWSALRFMAHDLKGFAGTLGHPGVSEVGRSLCRLIDAAATRDTDLVALAEAHLDAADFLRRNVNNADATQALMAKLELACARLVADTSSPP